MSEFKVTIWPNGESFTIDKETTLLKALKDKDIYVKSSCGGVGSCGDCVIKVHTGENNLTPPTFNEIKLLGNVFHITKERLSCQATCNGNVTIDVSHHDKAKDQTKTANKKFKKKNTLLKKKDDLVSEGNQAGNFRPTNSDKNASDSTPRVQKPKIMGGGRRPRAFNYSEDIEEE